MEKKAANAYAPPAGPFTSYEQAHDEVAGFEALLGAHGIKIVPGSELEASCLATMDLREQQRDPTRRLPVPALRDQLRHVVGLVQLVRLVLRSRAHPDVGMLLPHLRLLNQGSPTQNTAAPPEDQASNKLFELFVALAVMGAGRDVRLDDPGRSDGSNPDVLGTMQDGHRWGFACKVVHGDAPMTLFERILSGVEQIERSEADTGMVVVNFKNRLPHDELFPLMGTDSESGTALIGAHVNVGAVVVRLAEFVEGRTTAMAEEATRDRVVAAFRGKKALPGLLAVVQATAGVVTPRGPSPSMVGYLHLITFELPGEETRFTSEVETVLASMNETLHFR